MCEKCSIAAPAAVLAAALSGSNGTSSSGTALLWQGTAAKVQCGLAWQQLMHLHEGVMRRRQQVFD
jgi:hypothetical protein